MVKNRAEWLETLTPAELHAQGLAQLEQSLSAGHDIPRATSLGIQALALIFASMSAAEHEETAGSHRVAPGPAERPLGERVHSG